MSIRSLSTSTLNEFDSFNKMSAVRKGLPFATVASTTGSPNTGSYTDSEGKTWDYYEFTGNGSITFESAGYADVLVVGGGGASRAAGANSSRGGGGGGAIGYGLQYFTATSHTVTIGAGGAANSIGNGVAPDGSYSQIGNVVISGGGQGGVASTGFISYTRNGPSYGGIGSGDSAGGAGVLRTGGGAGSAPDGFTLDYKGVSVAYSAGGQDSPTGTPGSGGDTNASGAGTSGVVIVQVLR